MHPSSPRAGRFFEEETRAAMPTSVDYVLRWGPLALAVQANRVLRRERGQRALPTAPTDRFSFTIECRELIPDRRALPCARARCWASPPPWMARRACR